MGLRLPVARADMLIEAHALALDERVDAFGAVRNVHENVSAAIVGPN